MPRSTVNQVNKVNQVPAANGGGTARRRPTPEQIASHIGHLVDFTADYLLVDNLEGSARVRTGDFQGRVVAVLETGIVVRFGASRQTTRTEEIVTFRQIHSIRRAGHD